MTEGKRFWNDMGMWQWPCGCAEFQDGWEKCEEHSGKLISSDPSIQEEVVDNPPFTIDKKMFIKLSKENPITSTVMASGWTHIMPKLGTGAPHQKVGLPTDPKERKDLPIASGVLDYFPKALAEVAKVSKQGNDQHNGVDTPLRWDRSKSTDESDALIRHFLERGKIDSDGQRHSAKVAWRSLALLEKELEGA